MAHGKLLDVIQYDGDNEVLVHRSEIENFNSMSQLVVNQTQEAIFFKDGRALDLFGPGRYSLKTDNFPIIRNVFGKIFGGKDVFTCTVYFVNKVSVPNIRWGTDGPISLKDPEFGLLVRVRAYGQTGIRIKDTRKFLERQAGNIPSLDYTKNDMIALTRSVVGQFINEKIAQAVIQSKIEIFELASHLSEVSELVKKDISEQLDTYGLECEKFFISNLSPDEEDFEGLKQAKIAAASRAVQGEAYWKERQFDVMQDAAKNTGAGNAMAPGLGLGMGLGLGRGVAQGMSNIANDTMAPQQNQAPQNQAPQQSGGKCPSCGMDVPNGAKFCPNCGAQIPQKRFCSECGSELQPGAKFCPNCGKKVE